MPVAACFGLADAAPAARGILRGQFRGLPLGYRPELGLPGALSVSKFGGSDAGHSKKSLTNAIPALQGPVEPPEGKRRATASDGGRARFHFGRGHRGRVYPDDDGAFSLRGFFDRFYDRGFGP